MPTLAYFVQSLALECLLLIQNKVSESDISKLGYYISWYQLCLESFDLARFLIIGSGGGAGIFKPNINIVA